MKISRKNYSLILNTSVVLLGISFVYYIFLVDKFPELHSLLNLVRIIATIILISTIILKLAKVVDEK